MSVDLTLVPHTDDIRISCDKPMPRCDYGDAYDWVCSERFLLTMQGPLFHAFQALSHRCGSVRRVLWYTSEGAREYTTDEGDGPIHVTTAREVVTALAAVPNLAPKNRAVLAFFTAVHPEARVLLWWC